MRQVRFKTQAILLLVCAAGAALNVFIAIQNRSAWGIDFNQFYAASHLAGTGHLYEWERISQEQAKHGPPMRSGRLPVVSYGVKLVSWLPYAWAHTLWVLGCLAALMVVALAWPEAPRPWMAAALCWSMPCALLLLLGQDTPFWLMFFALALLALERHRPGVAGVLFSLCIAKYHLALAVPVMLVAQKRWRALAAAAMSAGLLLAACFAIEGSGWPRAYQAMLSDPLFSPGANRMPNLRGLFSRLPAAAALEIAGALLLAALLWRFCRRQNDPGTAGAAAAAAGLLLSHHGYANDLVLLMPLAVFTVSRIKQPVWLIAWAALLLTPAATLALVAAPLAGQLLAVGFVITALAMPPLNPSPLRENESEGRAYGSRDNCGHFPANQPGHRIGRVPGETRRAPPG
jgi:hypothetical protein